MRFFHHSNAINSLMSINFVVKEQSAILRLRLQSQTDAFFNIIRPDSWKSLQRMHLNYIFYEKKKKKRPNRESISFHNTQL